MSERLGHDDLERARHWDAIYTQRDTRTVSWFEEEPTTSLELVDLAATRRSDAVVDVGAGASYFVDRLVARGYRDVSALDVSAAALATSRERIDDGDVTWIVADVLTWRPTRCYDLWHDRAVFHFLDGDQIDQYRATLDEALSPTGALVVGTFALDGPESCSGLRTHRYDPPELAAALGDGYEVIASRRTVHETPGGAAQPLSWVVARRRARRPS